MKFHLLETHPASDGPDDTNDPVEIDRMWYTTLTKDKDVLERLLNPVVARDYLLRVRAAPLLDHARLYRVVLKRARQRGATNLLHDEFANDFTDYLELLPPVHQMIAEDLPAGYVLAQFYDAMCLRTEGGRIIVISEVLRYFLYFMTLANLEMIGIEEVPPSVTGSALTIAVRTMAMNEALDFDLDPRGKVPSRIDFIVNDLVDWQMRFIIGHEYAHHRLGHVGSGLKGILAMSASSNGYEWNSYQRAWEEEFDADIHAIVDVGEGQAREKLIRGSIMALLFIFFHERVAAALDPAFASINSHPPTVERYTRIGKRFGDEIGMSESWLQNGIVYLSKSADEMVEHFRKHPNLLTMYGSIYLGEWQGPELVDRVDY